MQALARFLYCLGLGHKGDQLASTKVSSYPFYSDQKLHAAAIAQAAQDAITNSLGLLISAQAFLNRSKSSNPA